MSRAVSTRFRLTADDKAALVEYWQFYEPLHGEIGDDLRHSLERLPEWAPLLRMQSAEQIAAQNTLSLERQRTAIIDGNWAPYLEQLNVEGARYAEMGVTFLAWYDVIAIYREIIRSKLKAVAAMDVERSWRVGDGMTRLIDIAMAHLGEAYLATKERIIARQQDALRELSLPILQVRDRLLVAPLVGAIDGPRAHQLNESLLAAIRDRRATGVVIDVTGVPLVDSTVAHHLVQVCEAARLMGARVVISGMSAEIAQALVAVGAHISSAQTVNDLQEGLEELERSIARATS